MEVILLERVERLGQMGDIVSVRPGFARNFLLPQKKALRATTANKQQFEARKAQLIADNLKRKEEAEAVAKRMTGLKLAMVRAAGESGQLFGSVAARDVSEAVTEAGFTINRAQVQFDRPIKTTGLHDVRIQLHPEVPVTVVLSVAQTRDEAEARLKTSEPAPAPEAEADAA
ncbi:MAG: 50S ribosomal protein L9 [Alphaproteobacteria bacterium]|nr:50S ribosomal protein L9 [Alphaproteobacteria bacterium]TAD92053.1 MAG: 50S ribosomal protein L9 [Alphaproteobacteria bacterium]